MIITVILSSVRIQVLLPYLESKERERQIMVVVTQVLKEMSVFVRRRRFTIFTFMISPLFVFAYTFITFY